MARPSSNDPIQPMTLGHMRQNGVRSLSIHCHQCRHDVVMNVDHLPDSGTKSWSLIWQAYDQSTIEGVRTVTGKQTDCAAAIRDLADLERTVTS